ncbi:hypothetical protein D1007_52829 [Hordeum vulgare]|nr:hypothetical protein D1007_52829 [Hordeum vulgare]
MVQPKPYFHQAKRQVNFDQPNGESGTSPIAKSTIIQQTKQNQVYYKCREPWVPGHRHVWKMSQKAQIQALLTQEMENSDVIYVTNFEDPDLETQEAPSPETVLQVSVHVAHGLSSTKNTFIPSVKIGDATANALVDSGSTTTFVSPEMASKMSIAPVANTKAHKDK